MLRFPALVTTKHSFGSHVWLSMEEDNLHVTEDRIGPGKISNLVPLKLAEN